MTQSHWILPETLVDAADGNTDFIADLIDAFQTDTQPRLKQVRRALGDSDHKGLRAGIHSIKGCAQQMGANAMASMCREIELAVGEFPAAELSDRLKRLETEFEVVCRAMSSYSGAHPTFGPPGGMV